MDFKFNFLSQGQLESLNLGKIFLPLFKIYLFGQPMYLYFGLAVSNIKMFPYKARLFEASRRFANFKV